MKKFIVSVRCAFSGIRFALISEQNIRIHLLIFTLALIASFVLNISKVEFLIVLLISALNFSLELANTSIERLADKVSPEFDDQIGVVKDVMAGAVLVSSLFAVVLGCIIFTAPLLNLLRQL